MLIFIFIGCENKIENYKYYQAISLNKKDTAYLKIAEYKDRFIGEYSIIYSDKTNDLGNISGEIIGDTLKGRFKYTSRRKSKFIKPIALLKDAKNLKLGTGMVSVYAQIPFYANGTIHFPDSLFHFKEVHRESIKMNTSFY